MGDFADNGIPFRNDGKPYSIEDCKEDQQEVMAYIIQNVKTWLEACADENETTEPYKPLRLTIPGKGGSGKSVLINTLATVLRTLFNCKQCIEIVAPTGSAAYNAGGSTMHHFAEFPRFVKDMEIPAAKQKRLLQKYSKLVVLVGDERSMMTSLNLGLLEDTSSKCMHGGNREEYDWGGIPIVILVGDDYQLPPLASGAFDALGHNITGRFTQKTPIQQQLINNGRNQFLEIGKDVMSLQTAKRQLPNQQKLQQLCYAMRGEPDSELLEEDAEILCNLNLLKSDIYSKQDIEEIEKKAMYLFANKEPRDRLNASKLKEKHGPENPVAFIKSHTHAVKSGKKVSHDRHYDDSVIPCTLLCVNSKVALTGRNFLPNWGLYNGSIGTVMDIVFRPGDNPNHGDLPLYILVDFPQYKGPIYIEGRPNLVPIPIVETTCNFKGCCTRKFVPLTLAFGKTIHTFQGSSAGPVSEGQPPNAVECIICDPGTRQFEGVCPGLFYTVLTRATTLGEEGNHLSSALYFQSKNMNKDRITDITHGTKGYEYFTVTQRKKWVAYLEANEKKHKPMDKIQQQELFDWYNKTRYTKQQLEAIIKKGKWLHNLKKK